MLYPLHVLIKVHYLGVQSVCIVGVMGVSREQNDFIWLMHLVFQGSLVCGSKGCDTLHL